MRFFLLFLVITICAALPESGSSFYARAENAETPNIEIYQGGDYTTYGASVYSSAVWSPFGSLNTEGTRLLVSTFTAAHGANGGSVFSGAFIPTNAITASNLMAGYAWGYDDHWMKFYAGVTYETKAVAIWAIDKAYVKDTYSVKAAFETWWKLNDRTSLSVDAAWVEVRNDISVYGKALYDLFRWDSGLTVSCGGETALGYGEAKRFDEKNNYSSQSARAGAVVRIAYGFQEVTFSSGITRNFNEDHSTSYATLSYGYKF